MYKLSALLDPGNQNPFQYTGIEAAKAARACLPGVVGCVQTKPLADQPDLRFGGVLELYFESIEDTLRAANFESLLGNDMAVACVVRGRERVVMRMPDFSTRMKIKGVYPFRRRPDLSVQAFQQHWWHRHGPIAALTDEALAYTQLHVLPACYAQEEPDFDGITEIYWPDRAAAQRALVSRQMVEDQRADAPNFVDMDSVVLFLAEEEIIIAP